MEFITEQHQNRPDFQACDQTIFKGQTGYNLNTLNPYIYIFL